MSEEIVVNAGLIFSCQVIQWNLKVANFRNNTSQNPRNVIYQTNQKALDMASELSGVSHE